MPLVGSQRSSRPNARIRISPSQNGGMELRNRTDTLRPWSRNDPGFSATQVPIAMPAVEASTIAETASSAAVLARREARTVATGWANTSD